MPGLMALREEFGASAAARRRPHHRLAAHDRADRRADRDPRRARRRRPLGLLQHLLHPGPRRRRGRGRPDGTPDAPAGVPVFAWKGETLEEYWWCTEQVLTWPGRRRPEHDPRRRWRRHAARPQGHAVREGRRGADRRRGRTPRSTASSSTCCARSLAADPTKYTRIAEGIKGVTEETTTGVHRLYEIAKTGELLFPAINVNDSVTKSQVRQQVRLPPLADRRHQPRHRRADRRQGRGRARLRRRRQGLRRVAARPGRPGHRHRDRPDLRAAGGDGRLPGHHARGRRRDRRHLHHRDRQQGHHHRRPTWRG